MAMSVEEEEFVTCMVVCGHVAATSSCSRICGCDFCFACVEGPSYF